MEEPIIHYSRTGGFAGLKQGLRIYDSGLAVIKSQNNERKRWLGEEKVHALTDLFEQNHFFTLHPQYNTPNCCDAFRYTITLTKAGQTHHVETNDLSRAPPQLVAIQGALENILRTELRKLIDESSSQNRP